jgi:hypothetical protein
VDPIWLPLLLLKLFMFKIFYWPTIFYAKLVIAAGPEPELDFE